MGIKLDDLIEQLQRVRQHLNENGCEDVDPEVVISDSASRCAKNLVVHESVVGGLEAAMDCTSENSDDTSGGAKNFVYLFGGVYEHSTNRYTPGAVLDFNP